MATTKILFLLFVAVACVSLARASACPQGCTCDMRSREIMCTGLSVLPSSVPPSMTTFKCFRCRLWNVRAQDVDRMRGIEKMYISSAHISNIDPYAFSALRGLVHLDLSGNPLAILDATSFTGLDQLDTLVLHSCGITDIVNAFDTLPKLRFLILHSNALRAIPKNVFVNMRYLQSLRIDWNDIEEIHPYVFRGLSSLRDLNLLANKIHTIHDGAFEDLGGLKQIYLGRNQLTSFDPNIFRPLVSLEHLNFFQNKVASFQQHQFQHLPNLREIIAHNNGIQYILPSTFYGASSVKTLHVSNNHLKVLTRRMLEGLDNVESFDVVSNDLGTIEKDAFQAMPNVVLLNMRNNTRLNIKDGSVFNPMRRLKKIYMQQTGLTQVPANMNLPELDQIELGDNHLTSLPKDLGLASSTKLKYVGLNDNQITEINLSHISKFSQLENLRMYNNMIVTFDESLRPVFENNLKHVRIDGNPIHCNCEVAWIKDITHNKFYGRNGGYNLKCATPHSKYLLRDTTDSDFSCVKPRFIVDKTHLKSASGDGQMVMTCTAYGDPAPKVSWDVIDESADGKQTRSVYKAAALPLKGAAETVEVLSLSQRAMPSTYKAFVCVAENRAGKVEKRFDV